MARTPAARARGFTLVELLVVVGIIALLIGIIVATLGPARNKARVMSCAARLKSIGTGVQLHMTDNRDQLPQMQVDGQGVRVPVGGNGTTMGPLFGGKIGLVRPVQGDFGLHRYGAASRPINRYLDVKGAPPDPATTGDESPEAVRKLSEEFEIDVFHSPMDRGFGIPAEFLGLLPEDAAAAGSVYNAFGTSYILNDHAISDAGEGGADPIERPTLIPCRGGRAPRIETPDQTWVGASYAIYNYDAGRDLGIRWHSRDRVEANILFADQHVDTSLPVASGSDLKLLRRFEGGPEWTDNQTSPAPASATNVTLNYSFLPTRDWWTLEESLPCLGQN